MCWTWPFWCDERRRSETNKPRFASHQSHQLLRRLHRGRHYSRRALFSLAAPFPGQLGFAKWIMNRTWQWRRQIPRGNPERMKRIKMLCCTYGITLLLLHTCIMRQSQCSIAVSARYHLLIGHQGKPGSCHPRWRFVCAASFSPVKSYLALDRRQASLDRSSG